MEISLGQYYPTDSILHKLDPRVKFLGTLAYIIGVFLVKGLIGYLFVTAVLGVMIALSRVPFRYILKSMKPIWFILIITVIFNLLLTPGTAVWHWGILKITDAGIRMAVRMALRLTYLVMGSSIMTLTTTPNSLTDAMESLFAWMKVLHVPVHEISMMMSIALRFIPILTEETDKIKKAQIARGADFESGNFIARMKAMIPLLVPLFVSAFRRANDLAMAMEARCYHGGDSRTRMKPLHYEGRDVWAYIIMAAFFACCIALCVLGI
ncbi:MAG: energy-coupling factor transporter transmembrane component T [Eubacteriales bacterium]|jgi:energy-coupling factor transport system permease protein|nr:energy-coupling factor transporter transmembrane protein EcfT [Lachnospiraceae bacterium]MDD5858982.1 energy-coupling factor transporter transmembrane component T [Eubacteriales bacterium]MCH4063064.1 energy-coupling factor transporter transmembrane protein EcfT [Lachnospiraceae bacterium]MCH4104372.1 energy-coupling factor transporter transmembrane protein EcfT [Lachnospiraceae bacterium]MCI1310213.1 energy-coupling factor transporter transmembrane protein EcfT [Lachnospiraceae bacterium]